VPTARKSRPRHTSVPRPRYPVPKERGFEIAEASSLPPRWLTWATRTPARGDVTVYGRRAAAGVSAHTAPVAGLDESCG